MKYLRHIIAYLAIFGAATTCRSALAQVPPPPLAEDQTSIISKIISSFQEKDLDEYASILDPDVTVFLDGEKISDNKDQWIKSISAKFKNSGILYRVGPVYASANKALMIVYFNSTMSWNNNVPADCCISYDAVSYDIHNGMVKKIQILSGGNRFSDTQSKL